MDEAFEQAILVAIGRMSAVMSGQQPPDQYLDQIATNFINWWIYRKQQDDE